MLTFVEKVWSHFYIETLYIPSFRELEVGTHFFYCSDFLSAVPPAVYHSESSVEFRLSDNGSL